MALVDDLKELYPWLGQLGLSSSWLQDLVARAASPAEIVAQIRATPQYRARFPGMYRSDGSVRMTEAQYLQQEQAYRTLLTQFGFNPREYATPQTLIGFFEGEIAPDELRDRLQVYRQVSTAGQRVKEAFYVYAGLDITDDDLYEAVVDPAAEQRLRNAYNQAVAQKPLDYQTWITRATQVGLSRVARSLQQLKARNAVSAEAIQKILQINPDFARRIMDSIYTGGDPGGAAGSLALQDLLEAFEFAAIGAAARNAGLDLPTKERLAQIRAAGVDRARAISAYSEFGQNQNIFAAAVRRARGVGFDQEDFERGVLLGDARSRRLLEQGQAYMEAAGRSGGSFRFNEENDRFIQQGFSRPNA
jgi:hypothetical protein